MIYNHRHKQTPHGDSAVSWIFLDSAVLCALTEHIFNFLLPSYSLICLSAHWEGILYRPELFHLTAKKSNKDQKWKPQTDESQEWSQRILQRRGSRHRERELRLAWQIPLQATTVPVGHGCRAPFYTFHLQQSPSRSKERGRWQIKERRSNKTRTWNEGLFTAANNCHLLRGGTRVPVLFQLFCLFSFSL